jgi:hypothetical protein
MIVALAVNGWGGGTPVPPMFCQIGMLVSVAKPRLPEGPIF